MTFAVLNLTAFHVARAETIPADRIGVVLMHGKWELPAERIGVTAAALRQVGALVETPEMPWSRDRAFDRSFDDSMKEIDEAVERLRSNGARRILVGGQGIGANAAFGYGARRKGLAGIILLAPEHFPGLPGLMGFQIRATRGIANAQSLASRGKGHIKAAFHDFEQGEISSVWTTPDIFLSWFAPDGPAAWASHTTQLDIGTPVFCADGSKGFSLRCPLIRALLPGHPKIRTVSLEAEHHGVPEAACRDVLVWIGAL
jgi:hypothetical protein